MSPLQSFPNPFPFLRTTQKERSHSLAPETTPSLNRSHFKAPEMSQKQTERSPRVFKSKARIPVARRTGPPTVPPIRTPPTFPRARIYSKVGRIPRALNPNNSRTAATNRHLLKAIFLVSYRIVYPPAFLARYEPLVAVIIKARILVGNPRV